jgi:imidazolonepropionase
MASLILVRGIRQLLTLHGPPGPRRGRALNELGIIRDGALLIRGGIIHAVGPSRRIENLAIAREAREVAADGRVVMPGFVDSHTHLLMTAAIESLPEGPGGGADVCRRIGQMARTQPSGRLELQAKEHLCRLARHGTTTVEVKSGWGPDDASEVRLLRVARAVDQDPLDVIPTYLAGPVIPSDYPDVGTWLEALGGGSLERWKRLKLLRFADLDSTRAGFGPPEMRRYYEVARAAGLPVKAHLLQPSTPEALRLAIEYGAVTADHLDGAPEDDLAVLARSTTIATLIPAHSFSRNDGVYPPARALVDAGAAIALATGFHPVHSRTYSMQAAVGLACSRSGLTPEEAISAATINGAHALRMAGHVGALEPGKMADLVFLNAPDYREITHLFGVNGVAMTVKRGVAVYKEDGFEWPEP